MKVTIELPDDLGYAVEEISRMTMVGEARHSPIRSIKAQIQEFAHTAIVERWGRMFEIPIIEHMRRYKSSPRGQEAAASVRHCRRMRLPLGER